MKEKKFFNKRKSKKKFLIFILIFSIISILFFNIFFLKNNKKFILIAENSEPFYMIPKDRGGEKVLNLDKKSLNLKSKNKLEKNINNLKNLFFSIQFYANFELSKVSEYLHIITNTSETIYSFDDFYIFGFNTEIGVEYFLLYKNFETRDAAKNYCLNFLTKIEKCLIELNFKLARII